jgi:hypothetical protein
MTLIPIYDGDGFPHYLLARPKPTFEWLSTPRFVCWPAGHYRRRVELEARDEHEARALAAFEFVVPMGAVRVQRVAPRLEGNRVA